MLIGDKDYENYTAILRSEMTPAMGCTEPIAIAYAAAVARRVLPEDFRSITVNCSGNMIKNVKGVVVPKSGGIRGIDAAAILGAVGGDSSKGLEVLESVTDADRKKAAELVEKKICEVNLAENVPNLYIDVILQGEHDRSEAVIENYHTNITLLKLNDQSLSLNQGERKDGDGDNVKDGSMQAAAPDRDRMSLKGLLEYADCADLNDVEDLLEREIAYNSRISQEGLDDPWGACVGKTILSEFGSDTKSVAVARAAAGSDARMAGCAMPVVINSGSGNQGITVTMPVLTFAEAWHISKEKMERALIVSNLVSIYIKHYIGSLSAFCGAVSAACGSGAAITYMAGGNYQRIAKTITNTLGNVGGIVCDGAKSSCAAKIAASVSAAILAHYMSMNDNAFAPGEGLVEDDVERTIKNVGYIGKVGMKETDREILNVMIDKVNVDSCL